MKFPGLVRTNFSESSLCTHWNITADLCIDILPLATTCAIADNGTGIRLVFSSASIRVSTSTSTSMSIIGIRIGISTCIGINISLSIGVSV